MSSSSRELYWWARQARLSEVSYFRQLIQQWRTFSGHRTLPLRSVVTIGKHAARYGTNTVYWTRAGVAESELSANKAELRPTEYRELNDAIAWARDVINNGGIAWLIACRDGTNLARSEIEKIVRKRGKELIGRPKKSVSR